MTKTPPEIIAKFDAAAPKDPRVVRKLMFGYPALFIGPEEVALAVQKWFFFQPYAELHDLQEPPADDK